jgi:hypothetical protein
MKTQLQQFACPIARYRGDKNQFSQEFNIHLQSFAYRVSLLAGMHTGGKLPTHETYQQLLTLWDELQPYLSLIADSNHIPSSPISRHSAFNALMTIDNLANSAFPPALDAD